MIEQDHAWNDYRARFASVYDDSNYSSPLQSFVMGKSHALLEQAFGMQDHFSKVLEIGAGTGEHVGHVRHGFDSYVVTDLDPAALEVAKKKHEGLAPVGSIVYQTQAAAALDFEACSFDRVIASHVLEHIPEPHKAIWEWLRVLRPGGTLSILLPSDPGIAWRVGRTLGPRRRAIGLGIAYDYVMAREHVNSCHNLRAILRHYFPGGQETWWPLPIGMIDLNLFLAFHATKSS